MPCGKLYEKLWKNYLAKYGDYRERLQLIRNDRQCFIQFQLSHLKQQSFRPVSSVKKSVNDSRNKKCDLLLPSDCCHSNRPFTLNQNDLDELEKLIQAENFPNNIFPVDMQPRSSIDNEIDLSVTNNVLDDSHRPSSKRSPMNSVFSGNKLSHSMTEYGEGSSTNPLSERSKQKSELGTTPQLTSISHDPTTSPNTNPYAQLLERLRRAEKTKSKNFKKKIDHTSFDTVINSNTNIHIQKFLSFLHSLDDSTSHKQTSDTFDENTLISLFSVDNHLSSSIYIPTNIHQLNTIPKVILHSLQNTSDNEQILNKIQDEISINRKKEFNSTPFSNITKKQASSNDDSQTSNFVEQDNELNSKLINTYALKAFKEYLIHHNKSPRLPKLFHDINQSI